MKKKKILCVAGVMGTGGVEEMVVELCNNLDKSKYDVSFFAYSIEQDAKERFDDSVDVYSLGYDALEIGGWNFVLRIYRIVKSIALILRKVNPDIIHINTTATRYLLVALLSILYSRKAVFVKTVHSSGYFLTSHRFTDRLRLVVEEISVLIRPTYLVGISKQVRDINMKLFRWGVKEYNLIYNGINLEKFIDSSPNQQLKNKFTSNDVLVAYVARVVDGKNHAFLLKLWGYLKSIGKDNIKLLLIGDGDLLDSLRKKVHDENLLDNVIFVGRSGEVPNILRICDFAVFPSEFEGFGLSLIEKMATGLPVIASDIPPFREIIDDKVNGYIVDLKDQMKWIDLILRLSEDRFICDEIGRSAIIKSKQYSIDRMVREYDRLYAKI